MKMEQNIQSIFIYFIIAMIVVIPIGIYSFILIDKIIKKMYQEFNDEWIKVGKPSGMFYYPPEGRNMQSIMSMQLNMFSWIFKTPEWIKNDVISLSNLKRLRFSLILVNLLMLGLFIWGAITIQGLIK
jgi:hypothetical protein